MSTSNSTVNGYGDTISSVAKNVVFGAAWDAMRADVGRIELPEGWSKQFNPTSLTVINRKRSLFIKVTHDAHVFVDRKLSKGDFRSYKLSFDNISDATAKARSLILEAVGKSLN